jgi:hypothetical protein
MNSKILKISDYQLSKSIKKLPLWQQINHLHFAKQFRELTLEELKLINRQLEVELNDKNH